MMNGLSRFWEKLAREHSDELDQHGFGEIKRRQALRYFTWRWRPSTIKTSEQMRFLLRNAQPRDILRAAVPPARASAWNGVQWRLPERYFYSFATRLLWQYAWREGDGETLRLGEPILGSPLPVYLAQQLISQDLANTALEVRTLTSSLASTPRHIVEVGAGYGRFAYAMLAKYPQATYTIIDIEPALTISRWYLGSLFGSDRLTFLDSAEASKLRPPDVGVSISSLQEMTPQQVQSYLELFSERIIGTVYLKQWKRWTNPLDSVTMAFDQYPIPHQWRQVKSHQAAVQANFTEAVWHTS